MFKNAKTFNSFSTNNIDESLKFYGEVLGLEVTKDEKMGLLNIFPNGGRIMVYPKDDHVPAGFTVLNFIVEDIDLAVDELIKKGVKFEQYDGYIKTDEKGIARGEGPNIAWFKDPAGNILSVLEANK